MSSGILIDFGSLVSWSGGKSVSVPLSNPKC